VPPCLVPLPPQCTQLCLLDMQIRFLGDPSVAFTKELDLSFDGASIFGGDRSKRYALVIENGAVKEAHVESDNTGLNGTSWLVVR
jgi:peroxiredoxin